jgi:hypothetical protein
MSESFMRIKAAVLRNRNGPGFIWVSGSRKLDKISYFEELDVLHGGLKASSFHFYYLAVEA